MRILVRNITKGNEFELELPMTALELEDKINEHDEYIIVDAGQELPVSELLNMSDLNTFLDNAREVGVEEDELEILTKAGYTYEEIHEAVEKQSYSIIDFDQATSNWMSSDINSDSDKGLCLFKEGYYMFPFYYEEKMQSFIDWEYVWTDASINGWRSARVYSNKNCTGHDYLVHIYKD